MRILGGILLVIVGILWIVFWNFGGMLVVSNTTVVDWWFYALAFLGLIPIGLAFRLWRLI